jgi:hypothetical protein
MNDVDRVYTQQGGAKSKIKLTRRSTSLDHGFRGTINLIVNPDPTPAVFGAGSGGGSTASSGPGASKGPSGA